MPHACATENLGRILSDRNICIVSDSQTAIKALSNHGITSELAWDNQQSLMQVAEHDRVQLVWVSYHEGIVGHEIADQLGKFGVKHPLIGPEAACGTSKGVSK
jgi:ribonuclease HI